MNRCLDQISDLAKHGCLMSKVISSHIVVYLTHEFTKSRTHQILPELQVRAAPRGYRVLTIILAQLNVLSV